MRFLFAALSTLTLIASSGTAAAAFSEQPIFSASLLLAEADSARGSNAQETGYGLRLGLARKVSDRVLLELQLSNIEYSQTGNDLKQLNAGIDAQLVVADKNQWLSYLLLGTGLQRSELSSNGSRVQNNYLDLGVGFYRRLSNQALALRGDLRWRRDFFDDSNSGTTGYDDIVAQFGIAIAFGGSPAVSEASIYQSYQEEVDSDQDGVRDSEDYCQGTTAQQPVDINGCSASQNGLERQPGSSPAPAIQAEPVATKTMSAEPSGEQEAEAAQYSAATEASQADASSAVGALSTDEDGDGVENQKDLCPNTPATAPINLQGCADEQIEPKPITSPSKATQLTTSRPVTPVTNAAKSSTPLQTQEQNFELSYIDNSDRLDQAGKQDLVNIATQLLRQRALRAEISISNDAGEHTMNYRRAKNLVRNLKRQGIQAERVSIKTSSQPNAVSVRLYTN